ncbi:MAG: segregation/condensation protein A [Clostridia bacterium]|nr:segregation/condensation protein A [Clostridia bacterium]
MAELNFKIEIYEGPLDLLLALITKHKIDIFDIPIAEIADQYTEYLDAMEKTDMEIAGEFIVMAAELMLIKSRMLLPRQEGQEDPRKPLVDALLEHRRAQQTALFLREQAELYYDRYPKPADELNDPTYHREHAAGLLAEAFARIAERLELERSQRQETTLFRRMEVRYFTVQEKMDEVYGRIRASGKVSFERLFDGAGSRGEVIAIFLAVLEAVRFGRIDVEHTQEDLYLSLSETYEDYPEDEPVSEFEEEDRSSGGHAETGKGRKKS